MADDYLSGSQFGNVAGALLARKRRGDRREMQRALLASTLFETIGAFQRRQQRNLNEEIESYQDAYVPIFKNIEVNFQNAQKTKAELEEYDRNKEVYTNKRINEEFLFTDFATQNNITANDMDKIQNSPAHREYYINWRNERKQEIMDEMELRRNNPYVQATSYAELTAPYITDLKNKIREVQNDPNKTSLLRAAFNRIFGKQKAGSQAAMEVSVEDFKVEQNNLDIEFKNFQNELKSLYEQKASKKSPEKLGVLMNRVDLTESFKNTDAHIKEIIDTDFSDIKDVRIDLLSAADGKTLVSSTPFDEIDEIVVQRIKMQEGSPVKDDAGNFVYENEVYTSPEAALAEEITYVANLLDYKERSKPGYAGQDMGVRARRRNALEYLTTRGVLVKDGRLGKVYLRRPVNLYPELINNNPELINEVNVLKTEAIEKLNNDTPLLETQYESYIKSKIDVKKASGEDFTLEQNKLSPANDKEYLAGQLEFLFNPPEELVGTAVMVGGKREILGQISQAQKEVYYEGFKEVHQVRNITLEKLLGLGEEPFREATEAEFNVMTNAQQNLYNSAISNRLRIIEDMESPDISLNRRDQLRKQLKETEINIAGLIENRGTTPVGRFFATAAEKSELGRIEASIKTQEDRLKNRRALTPQQIQDTEDRLKQLKQRKQELELGL